MNSINSIKIRDLMNYLLPEETAFYKNDSNNKYSFSCDFFFRIFTYTEGLITCYFYYLKHKVWNIKFLDKKQSELDFEFMINLVPSILKRIEIKKPKELKYITIDGDKIHSLLSSGDKDRIVLIFCHTIYNSTSLREIIKTKCNSENLNYFLYLCNHYISDISYNIVYGDIQCDDISNTMAKFYSDYRTKERLIKNKKKIQKKTINCDKNLFF